MKDNIIGCPFKYQGTKYKLIPQIKTLLKKSTTLVDLFAGGVGNSQHRLY